MTIDVSLVISILSVGFAIFAGVTNMKRNKECDDKKESAELTTVIVKLENINNDTKDIKNELRSIRTEVSDLRERVTIAEQAAKSLHHRVDKIEERIVKEQENEKHNIP